MQRAWILGFLVAGCTSDPADSDAVDPNPPDAVGPYAVGTLVTEVSGPDGLTLPLQVWFPASETEGSPYAYMGLLEGTAYETATPSCETTHPVVVFSHGNQAFRYVAFSIMERLASHGFVVIAPDHLRNTLFDWEEDYWHGIILRRPLDVSASFDGFLEIAAAGPLNGCVDPEAGYLMMGGSMGGNTAFAIAGAPFDIEALLADCEEQTTEGCDEVRAWAEAHPGEVTLDESDPRATSVLAITPAWPWVFGDDGLSTIQAPSLVLGGSIDTRTPWDTMVYPSYQALTAPKWLIGVEGAGHYSFSDFCPVLGPSYNGCGEDARPVEEVLVIARTVAVAWARLQTGDVDMEPWLSPDDGISAVESAP